jgi:hypothetical protein
MKRGDKQERVGFLLQEKLSKKSGILSAGEVDTFMGA